MCLRKKVGKRKNELLRLKEAQIDYRQQAKAAKRWSFTVIRNTKIATAIAMLFPVLEIL
jgi:hypothetical protein